MQNQYICFNAKKELICCHVEKDHSDPVSEVCKDREP